MKKIIDIEEIEKGKVLLYFKSDYCGDCVSFKKDISYLESLFSDISFFEVDKKHNIDLFKHYDVHGIPSFIYLEDAKVIKRNVSRKNKTINEVIHWIKGGK